MSQRAILGYINAAFAVPLAEYRVGANGSQVDQWEFEDSLPECKGESGADAHRALMLCRAEPAKPDDVQAKAGSEDKPG